jgi:uncharacterized C2H2 Zn-finger protein
VDYSDLALQKHLLIDHEIKAYVCEICGAYSTSIHYLKTHKQAVHYNIAKSKCDKCGKCFINKNNLIIHLKKAHGIGDNLPLFPCTKCGSSLATSSALKRHIETVHNKTTKFKCEHCEYYCYINSKLQSHIKEVHKKYKPNKCDYCEASFYYKRDKIKHQSKFHQINIV